MLLGAALAAGAQADVKTTIPPEIVQQPLPNTTPLAITVTPAPVAKGQTPQFVTMTLTNTTDHDVRLPEPSIGCANAATGSILLVVTPAREGGAGCQASVQALAPVEKWTLLKPGETANFGQMVTPLLPKGAGTIEVGAVYTPPVLKGEMSEELYRQSVTYETETLSAVPVAITRTPE